MYAEEDKYYSNGKGTHSSPPQVRLPATKPDLQATPDAEGRPGTPRADGLLDEPSIADCDIPSASLSKNQKQKLRKKLNLKKWKTGLEATEAAKDPDELPAAAFAPTVNENTSFSPLDPTVPLQEDFGVLTPQTPPPSKPVLTVQILPQPRREFPRDPSAPPTRPQSPSEVELEKLPIPELPSPVPPIPDAPTPPARPPFESVRPALFQKAFFDSINGAKFDDTQVYLCSARSKAGVAHKPMVVYVRSEFLHAASAIFTDGTCRFLLCRVSELIEPVQRSTTNAHSLILLRWLAGNRTGQSTATIVIAIWRSARKRSLRRNLSVVQALLQDLRRPEIQLAKKVSNPLMCD